MSGISNDKLVLHLPLASAVSPAAGDSALVINHRVSIGDEYAAFNGRDAYLEIRRREGLQFTQDDFTIAVQIWTEQVLDDAIGDILSQFDPAARRGLTLSVTHHAGAVTSQTNFRHVQFGVDDGTDPQWNDLGRVGNAVAVWALAVHEGLLYAGTYEHGANEAGRVYRHVADREWEPCGRLDGSNTVSAMAVLNDQLYAATRTEDPHGSLLEPTANRCPGGNVFQLNRDGSWTHCGKVCEEDNIFGLSVFRGDLYAWPAYAKGIYRYDGGTDWSRIPSPDSRLFALSPYHGKLYATANRLSRLDPDAIHAGPDGDPSVQKIVGSSGAFCLLPNGSWASCGNPAEETQIYSVGIHSGQMYVGTWPSGKVFQYQGDGAWRDCGRLGSEDEVMGLAIYNGMLYAGTLPTASIYRYDGDFHWTSVGQVDHTPNVPLRRAINMAVHQGRLCVGSLPSGHVWAMETGQVASHDRPLPAGWCSLVAMRRKGILCLYVNGQKVAESRPASRRLDLSLDAPLRIGLGRHDYFNGRMRNVRIYRRALAEPELAALSATALCDTVI
jgi:Concanavalin A-like lectin/glucanases superfamily